MGKIFSMFVLMCFLSCGGADGEKREVDDGDAPPETDADKDANDEDGDEGGDSGDDSDDNSPDEPDYFEDMEFDYSDFSGKIEPPKPFEPFECDPASAVGEPVTLSDTSGTPYGAIPDLIPGDILAQHFVLAESPLRIQKLRAFLLGGIGKVELQIVADFARSQPATETPISERLDFELDSKEGKWVEVELQKPVFVHPKDKFWVVQYINETGITLGVDDGAKGPSRSRLYSQALVEEWRKQGLAFVWAGVGENNQFMVEIEGEYICKRDSFWFTEVAKEAGFAEDFNDMRIAFGDVNNDGYDDLLTNNQSYDFGGARLFLNNGDFTFTDITPESGVDKVVMQLGVFGDIDNDGDIDLYSGVNTPQKEGDDKGYRDTILLNIGGVFGEIEESGVADTYTTAAAVFLDYDKDGCLDLYVGAWLKNYPEPASMPDRLLNGDCWGSFKDVTKKSGIEDIQYRYGMYAPCYGVTAGDYNNDGFTDIFVANYGQVYNFLLTNNGDGTFYNPDVVPGVGGDEIGVGGNTFGADFGDFDNDGDLDLFLAEISHPRYLPQSDKSRLMRNDGAPKFSFTDITDEAGFIYDEGEVDPTWIDFDNDGWLDMFIGTLYTDHFARLYRQCAPSLFCDVSYEAGIFAHDSVHNVWADIERDGDLDLIVSRRGAGSRTMVYRNEIGNRNNWVGVKLIGAESNRDAIGSRIEIEAGGYRQIREIKGGKGHFNSQPPLVQLVGLGEAKTVDKLTVRWISGAVETFENISPRAYYTIAEGSGVIEKMKKPK
ncbi:MAG: hypothetical protein Kow0090_05350 [Myxococcota bacterium]